MGMKLPQLSLRDLFWLVLVCAMGFGWLMDHAQMAKWFERVATHQRWQIDQQEKKIEALVRAVIDLQDEKRQNEWKQGERGIIDEPSKP
jgi:hypothetical protein